MGRKENDFFIMGEQVITIHPLDYLFKGLEASEVFKLRLVNLFNKEVERLRVLKRELESIRSIVKNNRGNSRKLTELFGNDPNFMPLVAKFISNLAELDELSFCDAISEMVGVINRSAKCVIQVQIKVN